VTPSEIHTVSTFRMRRRPIRISEMLAVQPTLTWYHHPEAGSTLELNYHESLKSS